MRHRVQQALVTLKQGDNWAYEAWNDGRHAYFIFESDLSARLVIEALHHMIKRKPLIHNGGKP